VTAITHILSAIDQGDPHAIAALRQSERAGIIRGDRSSVRVEEQAMPIHDWTRVDAGIFHGFHHDWITEIARALNRGLLPDDYHALAETDAEFYRRKESTIVVRHVSGDRIVAMLEVVSPGNKAGRHALRAFVE
jgi:hypothetical protein